MLYSLSLIAPALVPSWRFFDAISASPRIEFAQMETPDSAPTSWHEFRPRPRSLAPQTMLCRLVWNPQWNETLFLVSCAERLLETDSAHSANEIAARVGAALAPSNGAYFSFRIALISRVEGSLTKEIAYIALPQALPAS